MKNIENMINIINNPPILSVILSEGRQAGVEGSAHRSEILRCAQNDSASHISVK